MPAADPQRSCLGCREVRSKRDLLRFVLSPDRVLVPDLQRKLPGRGAYTCVCEACLRTAVAKRQFSRSFKGEVNAGTADDLVKKVAILMQERISSYLALANKGGKVVSGSDMVTELLKKRTPGAIFLASDISADSGAKISYLAEKAGIQCISLFDKEKLGALIGKEFRGVVAVEQGGFSDSIIREVGRYGSFFQGGSS